MWPEFQKPRCFRPQCRRWRGSLRAAHIRNWCSIDETSDIKPADLKLIAKLPGSRPINQKGNQNESAPLLASPLFIVLLKWTCLLALGWAAHWMLCHRHARWRLILWRSILCFGLALPLLHFFRFPASRFRSLLMLATQRICRLAFTSHRRQPIQPAVSAMAQPMRTPLSARFQQRKDSAAPVLLSWSLGEAFSLRFGYWLCLRSVSAVPAATSAFTFAKNLSPDSRPSAAGHANSEPAQCPAGD